MCTLKPPSPQCSCGARLHAERTGEDGLWARAPSLARVGECVLPDKQPLPWKITANASLRSGCAWPGSGRTRASSSPTRSVPRSTPPTCVTAPSSASKLEPASEMTYASTISGTRAATLLLSEGVNVKVVSELLGHASITITLNTYSHVLPDMQDSAAAAMEAALS